MITVRNLSKTYTMGENKVHALNNISFSLEKDDFLAITGPSGSGKSTLMNILGCLDEADEGEYFFDNVDIFSLSESKKADFRNNEIGFIFQQFNLISTMTAFENVELPLIYHGVNKRRRKEKIEGILERLNVLDRMDHLPSQLSGGQQQRIAIARAVVTDPRIIIADEPTGNLDSKSTADVMDILKDLNDGGKAIILITHDKNVSKKAKRILYIKDGCLIENGDWL